MMVCYTASVEVARAAEHETVKIAGCHKDFVVKLHKAVNHTELMVFAVKLHKDLPKAQEENRRHSRM